MTTAPLTLVLRHVRQLAGSAGTAPLTDPQLVERFVTTNDAEAFAALMQRHGPMVLGVCRRALHHAQDAEDVFQATFLIFAQKAASIRKQEAVASWLQGVAYRLARKVKAEAYRRSVPEGRPSDLVLQGPAVQAIWHELQQALDEELHRLPDKYRAPLVLCYLEGKTRDEARQQLGLALATFKKRLSRGRALLQRRLTRRGLAPGMGLLAAVVSPTGAAALPPALGQTTGKAASHLAAGGAATEVVSGRVAQLLKEGLPTILVTKWKIATALLAAVSFLALGAAVLTHQALADKPGPVPKDGQAKLPTATTQGLPQEAKPNPPRTQKPPDKKENKEQVSVTGRVLDAAGQPLANAPVALLGLWPVPRVDRGPSVNVRVFTFDPVLESHDGARKEVLAQGKTDRKGRFRLTVARFSPGQFHSLHVLAGAKGYGLGWCRLDGAAKALVAELRLQPEQVLSGRLIDVQGQPAAGVKLRPAWISRGSAKDRLANVPEKDVMGFPLRSKDAEFLGLLPPGSNDFQFLPYASVEKLPFWPAAVTTDVQGRFRVRGFGRNHCVNLAVEDQRFALQDLILESDARGAPKPITLALSPPRRIKGRVVYADTRKPVPNATVIVWIQPKKELGINYGGVKAVRVIKGRTDAQGRFLLNPSLGQSQVRLDVYPPEGVPYQETSTRVSFARGTTQRDIELALWRGVLIRGKVTEKKSGQPIRRASVKFILRKVGASRPVATGPDGTFRILVPPGPGHLLCTGPDHHFVTHAIGSEELLSGKPGGFARYYHAVRALDARVKDSPLHVALTLQCGVTIRGRLVGPDGKPVPRAVMLCDPHLAILNHVVHSFERDGVPEDSRDYTYGHVQPIQLTDSHFELPGCDPDKEYRVSFLDAPRINLIDCIIGDFPGSFFDQSLPGLLQNAKNKLGVTVDLSAKKAGGKRVTVRLAPCGAAEVRLVDARGKPAQKHYVWLEHVVRPGPSRHKAPRALPAEAVVVGAPASPYRDLSRYGITALAADAKGRIRFPTLIPGATYRLKVAQRRPFGPIVYEKDFTVKSWQTLKLPDIVVPSAR
jgi:RNA polymerase sigma factor (sigma-70 family)